MVSYLRTVWDRWFGGPLAAVEAASIAYRLSPKGQELDVKTVVVILTAATCLTLQNYTSSPERLLVPAGFVAERCFGPEARQQVEATLRDWAYHKSPRLIWFGIAAILNYTVLPTVMITLVFRERLTDYGVGVRGVIGDWPIYLTFATIMLPLVWLFSAEGRFQQTYPFFEVWSREDVGPALLRWEVVYAFQFVALEFFFRGFIVHGTKHRFGAYSVFAMVIPYCMIHYAKPIPETCGAIAAGVGLGLVSLVTRSIWPGAALHIMVAWGMDFSCLYRRGMIG